MRRCVGCMVSKPKKELIRLTYGEDGLMPDRTGKANGRGVYLCPDPDCLKKAAKKNAIARGLDREVPREQIDRVLAELREELTGGAEGEE